MATGEINYGVDGPFSLTGDDADTGFQAALFDARGLYEMTPTAGS